MQRKQRQRGAVSGAFDSEQCTGGGHYDESTIGERDSLKTRLKTIWAAGDYDRFSRYLGGSAREFYDRLDIVPGCQLLDIACGSGQLTLMAAKDGIEVTGVDIASNLVKRARAGGEGLRAREEADAESLDAKVQARLRQDQEML